MSELARFFEVMTPFVWGETSAADVEAVLGACPEGRARLALIARFVRLQHVQALSSTFATLRAELDRAQPGRFAELVDEHLRTARCRNPHPGSLARGFVEHLEQTSALPPWAAELADYVETVARLERESATFDPRRDAVNPASALRCYEHAIPSTHAARIVLLLVRPADDAPVRRIPIGAAELIAYGLASGQLDERDAASTSAERLRDARARLRREQVLGGDALDA